MVSKIVVSGLLCLTVLVASATEYPTKPIRIVVPFPPGSTSDLIPRLLAPIMSKSMGTSVIIENHPGANGSLGAVKVAAFPGDGYTVLMATTGVLAINQWIYKKPLYSASKDFTPVINAASTPNMLVLHPSVKANNLPELKAGIWYGFVVPSTTPKAIVDRLNAEFAKALRDPTVSPRLTGLGLTIVADKPEEFKEFVAQESNRMRKVVETSGASIQ